jgi:cell fate regulator YaaT (PSP1 superfamily)
MKLVDGSNTCWTGKSSFSISRQNREWISGPMSGDLAKEFKTRIELRQIGVRDESKVVKGMSPCGMPCCCSYWLNRFAPIA